MLQWIQLIEVIAPPILLVIPGMPPALIPIIIKAIQLSEQLPWLNGSEKKELVMKAVTVTAAATSPTGVIKPEASAAIARAIDATVHAANTAVEGIPIESAPISTIDVTPVDPTPDIVPS